MKSRDGSAGPGRERDRPGRAAVPGPRMGDADRDPASAGGDHRTSAGMAGSVAAQLHDVLHALAAPLTPSSDTLADALRRARRFRRRRRVLRGSMSVFALAAITLGGPAIYERVDDIGHPDARVAAPPAAVVDIATAYPLAEAPQMKDSSADADRPANALAWPARGATLPSQVLALAQDFLLGQTKGPEDDVTSAHVEQLWAGAGSSVEGSKAKGSTFFVLQGWSAGSAGPSSAILLAGKYTAGKSASQIEMYEAPLRFSHAVDAASADAADVADIAELSVWAPSSNRLLVLGAPQVTKVLYAADGKALIEEPTSDGVSIFGRAKASPRRGYVDGIQVRDAQNQALTPPGMWSAGDVVLGGDVAVYGGSGIGWQVVRAGGSTVPAPVPVPAPVAGATVDGQGSGAVSPSAPSSAGRTTAAGAGAASAPPGSGAATSPGLVELSARVGAEAVGEVSVPFPGAPPR